MSRVKRIEAELAIQKQIFFVSLASSLGSMGWMVTHFTVTLWWILICGACVVVLASFFAYTRYKRLYQLLEEFEDD